MESRRLRNTSQRSFDHLRAYVEKHREDVDALVLHGRFGDHVEEISRRLGNDPALVFVDPTGWVGADMRFIKPLASQKGRDVIINVMYDHIHRFKDANHEYLPQQMRDFFGLDDGALPPGLSEPQTMALYRQQLKRLCAVPLVADLVVPIATHDRTKFRLVVGGHHPAVLKLFRQVEYDTCGKLAGAVRTAAKDRAREARTGALSLFPSSPVPELDFGYKALNAEGMAAVRDGMIKVLRLSRVPLTFKEIWTRCLSKYHIRVQDVAEVVGELRNQGALVVEGWGARQRKVVDDQVVRLP